MRSGSRGAIQLGRGCIGVTVAVAIMGLDVATAQERRSSLKTPKLAISGAEQARPKPARTAAGTERKVIVTAQRRNETLQKVPIAITVIRGRRLEDLHLRRAPDISWMVPNMTSQLSGHLAPRWFLRGVGAMD
jgi:iron complex outermembrane receptor protein